MSTNKFIEKLDKDWFNNIKNNFKNKDDIDLLIKYTKQHNDLYNELNILNSYKSIFGID